jgi:hypothetical protein
MLPLLSLGSIERQEARNRSLPMADSAQDCLMVYAVA